MSGHDTTTSGTTTAELANFGTFTGFWGYHAHVTASKTDSTASKYRVFQVTAQANDEAASLRVNSDVDQEAGSASTAYTAEFVLNGSNEVALEVIGLTGESVTWKAVVWEMQFST